MILQLVVDHIDFSLPPRVSVMAPRFMTDHFISSFGQKPPALSQLRVNPEIGQPTLEGLKSMGHNLMVRTGSLSAAPCVIQIDPVAVGDPGRVFLTAGDPRTGRHAMAIK
jgi:gamma-glutamyltranspeptidase